MKDETVRAYKQAREQGGLAYVLADALRDAEARADKFEHEAYCFLASDEGCKLCARTDADWQRAADKRLGNYILNSLGLTNVNGRK